MNKFLCLLFFSLAGNCLLQAALVGGMIKNANPGEAVSIEIPQYYLNNRSAIFHGVFDNRSTFSINAEVLEPGLAFLLYNNDRLPIFLSNEDTLLIKSDAFQFPVVVTFSGPAAADNRLLQNYLHQNQLDFNEFNNIRFKIGLTWIVVEDPINGRMESLNPEIFKSAMDAQKATSLAMLSDFATAEPDANSAAFLRWINAEITYYWAYHLLAYGQVYAARFNIQPAFFDFLYDAPIISDQVSCTWYQQFILAFMARQQLKTGSTDNFWAGQYYLAEKMLSGKSLAFFRSELIANAFSFERFTEVLPLYTHFLQKNPFSLFDDKVEGLYQKYARVAPGTAAPNFTAKDLNGKEISLDQFRGKTVYLNFWASWCGACLRKMEFFDEFEAELSANNIAVVNISVDENPDSWAAALANHPYKGQHLLASSGTNQNIASTYGVEAVPQYFIISKTGLFEPKAKSSQPNDIRQQLLDIQSNRQ